MSKPLTNAGRIALREATYREPELPAKRCETCQHYWEYHRASSTKQCHLPAGRDRIKPRQVSPIAVCDAWEARP